jgi:hypothetical protein
MRTERKSWRSRPKLFSTNATDARIEEDTLGQSCTRCREIAVGPVVTVGTETDLTTGPTVTTAKNGGEGPGARW